MFQMWNVLHTPEPRFSRSTGNPEKGEINQIPQALPLESRPGLRRDKRGRAVSTQGELGLRPRGADSCPYRQRARTGVFSVPACRSGSWDAERSRARVHASVSPSHGPPAGRPPAGRTRSRRRGWCVVQVLLYLSAPFHVTFLGSHHL